MIENHDEMLAAFHKLSDDVKRQIEHQAAIVNNEYVRKDVFNSEIGNIKEINKQQDIQLKSLNDKLYSKTQWNANIVVTICVPILAVLITFGLNYFLHK